MEKAKAIYPNTTFALVPELATQVGYVVEGWTYIERVLRDTLIRLAPERELASERDKEEYEEKVALQLFHMANIPHEIEHVLEKLAVCKEPWAQEINALLLSVEALIDDRNSIIHGWFLGGHNEFAASLRHFKSVKTRERRDFTVGDYKLRQKTVENADAFIASHIEKLSRLITEAVSILHPSTPAS
ncbi:hypothetical protein [Asticcacaulis taihuensis]|uniref:hypothetical protein n=1 Tax=Asticcacaulis taihuensis TaxID=260084 RepID=UPI0026ED6D01|nr:hypothetical protein [Asticcacaulis taihuensis]